MAGQLIAASAAKGVAESKYGPLIIVGTIVGVAAIAYFGIYRGLIRPKLCSTGILDCETKEQRLARKIARFEGFSSSYYDPTKTTITPTAAKVKADQINDAFGFFNDNESLLYGALDSVGSKANLALVSIVYFDRHGISLPDDINARISYSEKKRIYDIISKLK
jgi:hypothetical protein